MITVVFGIKDWESNREEGKGQQNLELYQITDKDYRV
jgi:hypothetical protein